ncbi:MAG: NHL repeat-containing protein [Candidatus Micrarchaeia archaeon]
MTKRFILVGLLAVAFLFAGCLGDGGTPSVAPSILPSPEASTTPSVEASVEPTTTPSASLERFVWIASGIGVTKLYESNGTVAGVFEAGAVPESIAVDSEGNVWVADGSDGNGEVTKLDASGELIGTFVVGLAHPRVVLDPEGNVWVLDIGDKIEKLDPDGNVLGIFTVGMDPVDIIADPHGNVWVTGSPSGEIEGNLVKLNLEGVVIGDYYLESGASFLALDEEGNVLVANTKVDNVTKVSSNGGILAEYWIAALGLAVDAEGNIWATTAESVVKYSPDGNKIGEYPAGEYPIGISIDYDGNVWVSNIESSFVTKLNGATGELMGNYEVNGCRWNIGDATGFRYHHFVLQDD